jgi:hypothetical protein
MNGKKALFVVTLYWLLVSHMWDVFKTLTLASSNLLAQ